MGVRAFKITNESLQDHVWDKNEESKKTPQCWPWLLKRFNIIASSYIAIRYIELWDECYAQKFKINLQKQIPWPWRHVRANSRHEGKILDINILSKIEDFASFYHYITHIWLLISIKKRGNYFHKNSGLCYAVIILRTRTNGGVVGVGWGCLYGGFDSDETHIIVVKPKNYIFCPWDE